MEEEIQKPLGGHLVKGQVAKRKPRSLYEFPVTEQSVMSENAPSTVEKKAWLRAELKKLAIAGAAAAPKMPELNYFQRPINIGPTNVSAFSGNAVQPMKPGETAVSASAGTAKRAIPGSNIVSGTGGSSVISKTASLLEELKRMCM